MSEIENQNPNTEFNPNLPPEEKCLLTLLDLNQFQESGMPGMSVGNFYEAYTGTEAQDDTRTGITLHTVKEQNSADGMLSAPFDESVVDGYKRVATVTVQFDSEATIVGELHNFDFVKTDEGIRLMERQRFIRGDDEVMQYTRTMSEQETAALAKDAVEMRELIVEEEAELMKLGPLVEEQSEDGSRRFHIGDILSIVSGRLVSPRGMQGLYDILEYMTDDSPNTIQLGRFADECRPYLEGQLGKATELEIPETIKDNMSLYKWLGTVTEGMDGDPFLKVGKVSENDHAVIDPHDELKFDFGEDIADKMVEFDPDPKKEE